MAVLAVLGPYHEDILDWNAPTAALRVIGGDEKGT
jgi:hypothetical protein